MKIDNNINGSQNFKGIYNNKAILKSLETISDHGTTFAAATSLAMSVFVRPAAIALTPDTRKETKQYAQTNSIASGLVKFALVEAIALPIENAVKQIDKNPEKFLNSQTIKNLQASAKSLTQSRDYKFITQVLKQSTGLISAIPKSMITVALIPLLMNKLFKHEKEEKYSEYNPAVSDVSGTVFESDFSRNPSFKGSITYKTAQGIGKLLNIKTIQNIAKKFSTKDADIARNMSIASDLLLTASFIHQTNKNNKIEKERKKPLIYNNLISTAVTLLSGVMIDKYIKNNTQNFIKKFSRINKDNPKLNKYIEGINIVRPTLIFALLYYGILPIISTYLSDKTDGFIQKTKESKEKFIHKTDE